MKPWLQCPGPLLVSCCSMQTVSTAEVVRHQHVWEERALDHYKGIFLRERKTSRKPQWPWNQREVRRVRYELTCPKREMLMLIYVLLDSPLRCCIEWGLFCSAGQKLLPQDTFTGGKWYSTCTTSNASSRVILTRPDTVLLQVPHCSFAYWTVKKEREYV